MEYPSKLIEQAVEEISKLPGIGKKTALRLALYLLKESEDQTLALSHALNELRQNIRYCKYCHNISDDDVCNICASHRRDKSIICVVEDTRDVMAIENTSQYTGLYHVLGGVISPIEGVGPSDLNIDALVNRVKDAQGGVKEVIFALSSTMEGDTTTFYLTKKLKEYQVSLSTIARGIPIGGELEYADEITLGRSILSRTAYAKD
ncbi:recombination mediator RecR [Fulvivirga maritima]|uniref:recombination mediator RecR n=1 Tax=Fulvivirga maritima TaxID=2904247 RepID=UPI001F24F8C9|nr:recombination mediator RecR [Fulvivirga maritima]UII28806.1 recombination mediator RecR [Fulvivirga maritima]